MVETIRDQLKKIANSSSSSIQDEKIVQYVMNKVGLAGKVTYGIVYVEPYNSTPPVSIHQFAQELLKTPKGA